MEKVIEFKSVWKKFKRGRKLLLKEALLDIFKPGVTTDFWALKDVNFSIQKGEAIGIIGKNGSGKSTILKLIAGVIVPTKGEVEIKGKIAPLIELGAGFHPELSGRENIYLNAAIMGVSRREVDEKFDEIVDFAEIREFIDTPVKHYSSGMYMRLAFAIAINVRPEILLIDEVLAVGDAQFQRKCMAKMENFKKNGVTIIFVSHSMKTVGKFCEKVLLVNKGKVEFFGESPEGIKLYEKENS